MTVPLAACRCPLMMLIALAGTCVAAESGPFLNPVFSDHAVLQRDRPLPVWGWSTPGDTVRVTLDKQTVDGVAGADGRWQVTFTPVAAGGPYTLTATGAQSATINDLLVGDVWLCSGQSNMEWVVANSNNVEQEVAAADLPQIRQFTGTKRFTMTPQVITGGGWAVCSPTTVRNFTAVGYFFGRDLHRELKIPIGLVNASWGGTRIEAWTSAAGLTAVKRSTDELATLAEHVANPSADDYATQMAAWWEKSSPAQGREGKTYNDSAWPSVDQPGNWEGNGLPDFDGIVWFRRTIDVPAAQAGAAATLRLGPIDDQDTTWINGTEVGATSAWNQPRVYAIPAGLLNAGPNVIAIRVLDTGGGGGMFGKADDMKLDIGGVSLPLAGQWRREKNTELKALPPTPARFDNPNIVTGLSNGMIEPLVPMALAGAIWYQGESNAGVNSGYEILMPGLIADWRKRFNSPDLPFGMVQLANFTAAQTTPVEEGSGWAYLRNTQLSTFTTIPHTGMAVITDIGDANDIHPRNKQDVGKRLAMWALHDVYGRADIARSGPIFKAATVENGTLRLSFTEIVGGLKAKGDLAGFAIAGADGSWVTALAKIDGENVIVSSPQVSAPTKVRYAWGNNPSCTLYNGADLPASPFRSDF